MHLFVYLRREPIKIDCMKQHDSKIRKTGKITYQQPLRY